MTVFVDKGSVRLRDHVRVGSRLVVQVFEDKSRGDGQWKASLAWWKEDYEAKCALQATRRATEEAEAAAKVGALKAAAAAPKTNHLAVKVQIAKVVAGLVQSPPGLAETVEPGETNDRYSHSEGNGKCHNNVKDKVALECTKGYGEGGNQWKTKSRQLLGQTSSWKPEKMR